MGLQPTAAPMALVRESRERQKISIGSLLHPHIGALLLGFIAIAGESAANPLQPWPLKIVLDDVHAWTMKIIHRMVGTEAIPVLKFACAAVLAIAVLDAICTYKELRDTVKEILKDVVEQTAQDAAAEAVGKVN